MGKNIDGWSKAIENSMSRANRDEFGYNQMQLNYITDISRLISQRTAEFNWTWVNREYLKMTEQEKENFFKSKAKEIDRAIEMLKTYVEPREEDKPTEYAPSPEDSSELKEFMFEWEAKVDRFVVIKASSEEEAHQKWMEGDYDDVQTNDEDVVGNTIEINGEEYYMEKYEKILRGFDRE